MKLYPFKYGIFVFGCSTLFAHIVACGSLEYQVSLKGDTPSQSVSTAQNGIHAPGGWKSLPIPIYFGEKIDPSREEALINAMDTWEKASGIDLFSYQGLHSGVSGDSFTDLYGSLDDETNGYYFDQNWAKTAKPGYVLGTTIWFNDEEDENAIVKADIRFNEQTYLIGDSVNLNQVDHREVVDLESLALHEIGHLLGLAHVSSSDDRFSAMNPSLFIGEGLYSRTLSQGDINRIKKIYGCQKQLCQ